MNRISLTSLLILSLIVLSQPDSSDAVCCARKNLFTCCGLSRCNSFCCNCDQRNGAYCRKNCGGLDIQNDHKEGIKNWKNDKVDKFYTCKAFFQRVHHSIFNLMVCNFNAWYEKVLASRIS